MSKKAEKTKVALHIPANEKRVKVEQIAQDVKQAEIPKTVTLGMLHVQNTQILEQNAYIIERLKRQ